MRPEPAAFAAASHRLDSLTNSSTRKPVRSSLAAEDAQAAESSDPASAGSTDLHAPVPFRNTPVPFRNKQVLRNTPELHSKQVLRSNTCS